MVLLTTKVRAALATKNTKGEGGVSRPRVVFRRGFMVRGFSAGDWGRTWNVFQVSIQTRGNDPETVGLTSVWNGFRRFDRQFWGENA